MAAESTGARWQRLAGLLEPIHAGSVATAAPAGAPTHASVRDSTDSAVPGIRLPVTGDHHE